MADRQIYRFSPLFAFMDRDRPYLRHTVNELAKYRFLTAIRYHGIHVLVY